MKVLVTTLVAAAVLVVGGLPALAIVMHENAGDAATSSTTARPWAPGQGWGMHGMPGWGSHAGPRAWGLQPRHGVGGKAGTQDWRRCLDAMERRMDRFRDDRGPLDRARLAHRPFAWMRVGACRGFMPRPGMMRGYLQGPTDRGGQGG